MSVRTHEASSQSMRLGFRGSHSIVGTEAIDESAAGARGGEEGRKGEKEKEKKRRKRRKRRRLPTLWF